MFSPLCNLIIQPRQHKNSYLKTANAAVHQYIGLIGGVWESVGTG